MCPRRVVREGGAIGLSGWAGEGWRGRSAGSTRRGLAPEAAEGDDLRLLVGGLNPPAGLKPGEILGAVGLLGRPPLRMLMGAEGKRRTEHGFHFGKGQSEPVAGLSKKKIPQGMVFLSDHGGALLKWGNADGSGD